MANFLYTLIISPLVQIIEIAYILIYKVFNSPSIAIVGVSAAVTFLCLPLYVVAEKWQQTERDTAAKFSPKIAKIKAAFKGDEQYLILSTHYRQNHYHPLYALRSSFGILIQIPFFIAAYSYLSHLEALKGVSFLFIHDLSAPDSVIRIGTFTVNILPVAMTVINVAAAAIYARGFPAKEKIQLYGMAAVFLVLLYNSPAGLVLYWTMNNVLSLVKNIFYKLKNPLRVLYILLAVFIALAVVYLLCFNTGSFKKRLLLTLGLSALLCIPLAIKCVSWAQKHLLFALTAHPLRRTVLFVTGCAALALLTGLRIPSGVIASSPEEFSFIDSYTSPLPFLFHSVLQSAGLFFFWPLCVYALFGAHVKNLLAALFSAAALLALVNAFAFQGAYGTITNTFTFNSPNVLAVSKGAGVLNAALLAILFPAIFLLLRRVPLPAVNAVGGIIAVSLVVFSAYNILVIHSGYKKALALTGNSVHTLAPVFSLSRDKANVVVVMADRAIGSYVPPVFAEHPLLREQFDGFTFYPNTVSFAGHTYDNTRIIIVSDHGTGIPRDAVPDAETLLAIPSGGREQYQPVLLVKDFAAHGELQTDMSFMTNADVSVLALNGIIDNPVNPFTGKAVTNELKKDGVFITTNSISMPLRHSKNVFAIQDNQWLRVHDNILMRRIGEKANNDKFFLHTDYLSYC
ncbi:MAG: YidC/Oxa1 family membrane protein insertase [Treponema sp.]|jgi:YidC/Oxa1 family membrane protein insertase|nr:YidC/Oxa1 family membrane protein insertase [Treponema sp.]